MQTHRQRSFIAEVSAAQGTLHFLDQLHGAPVILGGDAPQPETPRPGWLGVGLLRGFRLISRRHKKKPKRPTPVPPAELAPKPQTRDESHYLGYTDTPMTLPGLRIYFRSTETGYRLFIRSDIRYGHALFLLAEQCLGASTSDGEGRYADLFDLQDSNGEHLDPASADEHLGVYLSRAGRNAPLYLHRFVGLADTYVRSTGHMPLVLNLRIVERNVAYVSNPDEI